jgi:hypothetical protein
VSALPDELPRKTVQKWRNALLDPDLQLGIDWLRRYKAPRIDRATVPAMVESGISLAAYHSALDDIETLLTALPKVEKSAEAPGLVMPDSHDEE